MFEAAYPIAMTVVAVIGTFTALLAAVVAVTMSDIKKVLAYSTISQLGFMMAALGVGGYIAAIFHLTTHAFFKALLFLGAGSVIHGAATQNIYEMGGLMKKMKLTGWTFLIATLSIAGIAPLSGFWSKDEILTEAARSGHWIIFAVLLVTAFLTAFYMFRLYFLVFTGKLKDDHVHESPSVMTVPLVVLAVPAALLGLLGAPFFGNWFGSFISPGLHHAGPDYLMMLLSTLAAVAGIGLSWAMYSKRWLSGWVVINALTSFSWLNTAGVDRSIKRLLRIALAGSESTARFDKRFVDGLVNGVGGVIGTVSQSFRQVNTGIIQRYAMRIVISFMLLSIAVYVILVKA